MSEIRVPTLGESIVEATVSKWLKQEGDQITTGEPIVELETDKVNLEVAAEQDGVLSQIVKGEGDTVAIGDVLATIGEGDGAAPQAEQAAPQAEQAAPQAEEAAAPAQATERQPAAPSNGQQAAAAESEEEQLATPVAMRVAAENDVNLRDIAGSGPGGRVTKEDVLGYLQKQASAQPTERQPAAAPQTQPPRQPAPQQKAPATPQPERQPAPQQKAPAVQQKTPAVQQPASAPAERREERVRMSRRRQTIAKRLVEAQRTAAMLTTFNDIDMSAVMQVRQRRKDQFKERYGINLGFMSFFTRAVIGALKAFPHLNAEIQGDEIVIKHYYDIGIAVGTEQGLVVPVVRDAERKTFAQIEGEIGELARRARDNTLTLTELQGGTFSITNGGIYGSLLSTPILNAPQVGILGLHRIEERPVAVAGEVMIRPMMYVALSYDHRIVDGSDAVRFLARIKELVEDPEALLIEG
jgi:2-oxoglutarate dehydrogenase E2 component (dihydrolipoamide succinyltransferase)